MAGKILLIRVSINRSSNVVDVFLFDPQLEKLEEPGGVCLSGDISDGDDFLFVVTRKKLKLYKFNLTVT